MKKIILSFLSFLLIGNLCFADNTGNYKKIISAGTDQQNMLNDLTNVLEQQKLTDDDYQKMNAHFKSIFQPEQEEDVLGNNKKTEIEVALSDIKEIANQQENNPSLLDKYPEFLQTCMEGPLTEALAKNPKLEIKELKSDRDYTKKTFTLTAITTTGKKISAICENKDALPLIMDLWDNADKTQLQNYRALHKQYPKILKSINNYIYEKTGKQYNKTLPFKCHTEVEVYQINTSDKNEYWDQVDCMPVLYRYNKGSKNYQYAIIAPPNYYPVYGVNNMVKVNGYIWYDTLTPRSNPPSFSPFEELAPTPTNEMNYSWLTKLLFSERGLGEWVDLKPDYWKKGNPKGQYIPNNGIFPIIKITTAEMGEVLGMASSSAAKTDYKPGYYCGEHFSSIYKDHSNFPAKWRFSIKSGYPITDFIPNKSYDCDSLNPALIRRISQVMYPEVFTEPIHLYYQ